MDHKSLYFYIVIYLFVFASKNSLFLQSLSCKLVRLQIRIQIFLEMKKAEQMPLEDLPNKLNSNNHVVAVFFMCHTI